MKVTYFQTYNRTRIEGARGIDNHFFICDNGTRVLNPFYHISDRAGSKEFENNERRKMMARKFYLAVCCLIAAGLCAGIAYAEPSVNISRNRVTIQEKVTDAILADVKKEVGDTKDLIFRLVKIESDEDVAKLCAAFPGMKELDIDSPKELTSIAPVTQLKGLTRFWLKGATVSDYSPLSELTELTNLDIEGNSAKNGMMAPDLKWMSKLTNLTRLNIGASSDVRNLVSFEGIPAAKKLTSATIKSGAPADLTPLQALSSLKTLELTNSIIADLTPLTGLPALEKLSLYGVTVKDFSPLAGCTALKELTFYATKGADYSTLGKLTQLENLQGGLTELNDISWISGLTKLKNYRLFAEKVTDYTPLAKLKLEELMIWNMKVNVIDLDCLSDMTSMKKLTLDSLEGVKNVEVLQKLTALTSLTIIKFNTKGGESVPLDLIKKLPNLTELTVSAGVFSEDQLTGFAKSNIKIQQRR